MGHQDAADNELVWMFHPTPTTALEDPQDSMLPDISTALVSITTAASETAQRFAYRPNAAEQACGKVCAANHKLAARSWVRVQQLVTSWIMQRTQLLACLQPLCDQ